MILLMLQKSGEKTTWDVLNPKQPFIHGCFNWMIPNLDIENWLFHQTSIYKLLFGVPGAKKP